MPLLLASINLAMNPGVLLPDSYGTVAYFIIVLALSPLLPFLSIIIETRTMKKRKEASKLYFRQIIVKIKIHGTSVRSQLIKIINQNK